MVPCSFDGPSVIAKTLSVVEAIDALASTVALVGTYDGLNASQVAGLQAKLAAAVRQHEAGRSEQAVALLDAFVQQVEAFAQAGLLSPYSAQILIYEASVIRNYIG